MVSLQFLYAEQAALLALGAGLTQQQFVTAYPSPLAVSSYQQAMTDAAYWLSWGGALNKIVLQIEARLGRPLPPPGGLFPINGRMFPM
ncbi:MAG: hypothetical protein ACYCOU_00110 [Sulfobacillus sp.]